MAKVMDGLNLQVENEKGKNEGDNLSCIIYKRFFENNANEIINVLQCGEMSKTRQGKIYTNKKGK